MDVNSHVVHRRLDIRLGIDCPLESSQLKKAATYIIYPMKEYSRCQSEMWCIWDGLARVQVEAAREKKHTLVKTFRLATNHRS